METCKKKEKKATAFND